MGPIDGLLLGPGASFEVGMPLVWELTSELKNWLTPEHFRELTNKEMLPAYWSYDDKAQMVIGKPADALAKAFAVDENSDYQTGGVIVALPPEIKAKLAAQNGIKRPTAIDGLAFDQFQIVEDPEQCFGITSGGVGEVVVAPVKFSQTVVKQTF